MTLIQAQQKFIDQVNACVRPKDRGNRVRRSAARKLRAYCEGLGLPEDQIRRTIWDAWDVAELEHNAED
jgi:hypothetical protein